MFTTSFTIEFGDCDEAGIAFYPHYFYWFDCTFQRLLRARGLSQRELKRRLGGVTPVIDVGAQFSKPITYDDTLEIGARVDDWQERRFRVAYECRRGDTAVARGFELRAWAAPDESGRLRSAPIPDAFKALIG